MRWPCIRSLGSAGARMLGAAALAVVAVAYFAVGYYVIFTAKIGATMTSLTATHGIHQGDPIGVAAFALSAATAVAAAALAGSVSGRRAPARTSYRPYGR